MQVHNVHIPRAVILEVNVPDREHWLGPMQVVRKSRTSAFLCNLRNLKQKGLLLLRLRVILVPDRALDPWRWPKGSQLLEQ